MTTLVTLRRLVTAIFCTTVIFFCSAHVAFAWGSYGPVMRGTTGVSISFNVTMGGLCAPYTTAPAPEGTAWMAGAAGLPTGVVALPALNNPGTFNYGCNSNPLNGPPDVVSVTVNDCPVYGLVWNGSACVPPVPPPTAPTGFTATPGACGTNFIQLTWNAVAGATGYTIIRDGATTVYNNGPWLASVLDAPLAAGTSHSYSMYASNSSGNSPLALTPVVIAPSPCAGPVAWFDAEPPCTVPLGGSVCSPNPTLSWNSSGAPTVKLTDASGGLYTTTGTGPQSYAGVTVPYPYGEFQIRDNATNIPISPTLRVDVVCASGTAWDGSVCMSYQLNVIKDGTGGGTVTSNVAGISCGADCAEVYPYDQSVTLSAVPSGGSVFNGWTPVGFFSAFCDITTPTCVVSMHQPKTVRATFDLISTLSIIANPPAPITMPAPNFTVTYTTNGTSLNSNCRVLDSLSMPITAYAPCTGSITVASPGAAGSFAYFVQIDKFTAPIDNKISNQVVLVVSPPPVTAPTLINPTVTAITTTGATLGANITSNGGSAITSRGTCWGTVNPPATNCVAEGGTALGVFTHARSGMTPGTTYFVRGYAVNAAGTGYSPVTSFDTTLPAAPPAPSVTSNPVGGNVASGQPFTITSTPQGANIAQCEEIRTSVAYGNDGPNYLAGSAPWIIPGAGWMGPGSATYTFRCQDIYGQWSPTASVTITVASPVPNFTVNPVPGTFGSIPVLAARVITFRISNVGGNVGSLLSGTLSLSDPHFTCPGGLPSCTYSNIPVGGFVDIDITYRPTVVSPPSDVGTMTFTDNAAGSPHVYPINGSGSPTVISVPLSVNFGTVPVTRYKDVSFIIQNVTGVNLPAATFSIVPSADSGLFTCISALTCAPGGIDLSSLVQNIVTLRFAPLVAGAVPQQSGVLSGQPAYVININGAGALPVFNVKER